MQNIKIPQRVGDSITRHAYLELIDDTLKLLSVNRMEMNGYAYDSDRVHFTYRGKKCLLCGIGNINTDTGDFMVQVIATKDGVRDIWELPVNVKEFHFKTLDRIAYEVYDFCKGDDWDDFEVARKKYIAGGMDRYREFMS